MAARTKRSDDRKARFLAILAEGGSVKLAAEKAKIGRRTAYEWKAADPEFAAAWEEAVEAGTDALEDEAKRRAYNGVDEPVFYQGEQCGLVRKYSDTLLIFLLKARRPEKYRERTTTEVTGKDGGPIETRTQFDLSTLTTDELRQLRSLASRAAGKPAKS